ncbi:hypothetical protein GCM10008955_30480 [Deinococcus malanensis]|uniref:Uncharacterized protein n=1 Tax=Deinococcus malanensis TaxID=1706855 RepID=A0ABQ2F2J1_9DEIO|nr:hypothetical protein [Deinococcus malanensis]GGK34388.1 hypothetical protein GCM10008955_30480 [Deinococcus malanensis]
MTALNELLAYTDVLSRPRASLAAAQAMMTPAVCELLVDLQWWHTETLRCMVDRYGVDVVLRATQAHLTDIISTVYGELVILGPRGKRLLGVRSGTPASTTPDAAATHLYRRRALAHLEKTCGLTYDTLLDHGGRLHRALHTMRDPQGRQHVVMASHVGYAPATIRRAHQGMFARLILEQADLIVVVPDRRRTAALERRPGYRLQVVPFRLPRG